MNYYKKIDHLTFWQKGKLSGYPTCCVIYFLVRYATMTILGDRFVMFFTTRIGLDCGFVECPYHNVMIRLKKFKVRHYKCKICGWDQINKKKCMIAHLHRKRKC